ncbi:hypothetical protein GHO41_01980 [Pseudomonas sp. FSL R10-0399]|uniref:DUF6708 domain-containing protein n=1 Tax=Pseudomonas sp. FSL R10-0399 TaxID=2662194 RepID=UPI001294C426|nr:DUF6708 domain-containing protein [Pseudomonas sp. FSL R10-0399]MQT56124.1 hypothetical protein [Pseudomonas sp. FSL R10-0399]
MSAPTAGTSNTGLFSQRDYLAPLPIPTGEKPIDTLNLVWRKNDIFIDIGNYSIGSALMILWPMALLYFGMAFGFLSIAPDFSEIMFVIGGVSTGIPALMLANMLYRPTPLPIRFNRQRREVCVPRKDGEYWIVPWETVTAAAAQSSSVSQAGRNTSGMLFIGFDNPDPHAEEDNKHFYWGFNCGGNEAAMSMWECMRSFMEIGPHALPQTNDFEGSRGSLKGRGIIWGTCCEYAKGIWLHLREGEFFKAAWLFIGIFIFGGPIVFMLQTWKLSPPPAFDHPDIIEWSKPLPPEQWAKRSPELELAIARREAELAAQAG